MFYRKKKIRGESSRINQPQAHACYKKWVLPGLYHLLTGSRASSFHLGAPPLIWIHHCFGPVCQIKHGTDPWFVRLNAGRGTPQTQKSFIHNNHSYLTCSSAPMLTHGPSSQLVQCREILSSAQCLWDAAGGAVAAGEATTSSLINMNITAPSDVGQGQ